MLQVNLNYLINALGQYFNIKYVVSFAPPELIIFTTILEIKLFILILIISLQLIQCHFHLQRHHQVHHLFTQYLPFNNSHHITLLQCSSLIIKICLTSRVYQYQQTPNIHGTSSNASETILTDDLNTSSNL